MKKVITLIYTLARLDYCVWYVSTNIHPSNKTKQEQGFNQPATQSLYVVLMDDINYKGKKIDLRGKLYHYGLTSELI